jgi:hypothetical protein
MRKIKNCILAIALLILPILSWAQETVAQRWVRSFDGKQGITTISISRGMFKVLSKVKSTDPEYQDIIRFASKLQEFKIVIADEGDKTNKTSTITNEFNRLIANAPLQQYEELMSINEGMNEIVFRVLERNDHIQELLMTITGTDQIVMFIKGDFKLNELTDISDDLNISGMNKIQKLKK